jgi:uncharacterized caspase-like protein
VILLLDACHSGAISHETVVPNDELAQRLFADKKAGVIVLSSSKGRQVSLESSKLGGGFGLFTYAVTNALVGNGAANADYDDNGYVEFMELVDYVVQQVEKESGGLQTPWLARRELLGDFPIASVSK